MSKRPIKMAAGAVIAAVTLSAVPAATVMAQDFDWRAHDGETITFLANQHPWTDGMTPLLEQFTADTGIEVDVQAFSEDLYFDKMEQTVRAAEGSADVYFLPMDSTAFTQFSAGAIEPLSPYLNDPSKTSPDYDFADIPAGFMGGVTYPPGDTGRTSLRAAHRVRGLHAVLQPGPSSTRTSTAWSQPPWMS